MKKRIRILYPVLSLLIATMLSVGLFESEVAEARDFTVASWGGFYTGVYSGVENQGPRVPCMPDTELPATGSVSPPTSS